MKSPRHLYTWIPALAWILLFQDVVATYVETFPQKAVVMPNQNVTFLCRVGVPLQYCRVEVGGKTLNLKPMVSSENFAYFGAGLQAGQCGVSIAKAEDSFNGQVKCALGLPTQADELTANMTLIVAKSPRDPELELSRGTDSLRVYKMNDVVRATCVVKDGRPPANITWFLDDEVIYDGLEMATIFHMSKEDLYTTAQNLSKVLRASDNGKTVRCVAGHPAWPHEAKQAVRLLDVKFAPLPQPNPIDKFGFELGKAGIISVTIDANPTPRLEWNINGEQLREGTSDKTGRIEAETARDEGRGRYVANLRIASITKHDTETNFKLTAYNDQGSTEYYVVISTSPEPEGLDLGAGQIIGIVIGILLLLLIVFLIVFARATGRWCFSGNRSRGLGENSDTESADVRAKDDQQLQQQQPKESRPKQPMSSKLKPPMFLQQLFAKNKDKVSHEDDDETRAIDTDEVKVPLEDDVQQQQQKKKQEGLVYAELDLKPHENLRPVVKNDDDKTEYAEIVYTQKEEDDNKGAETAAEEAPKEREVKAPSSS